MIKDATLSSDRKYRYELKRIWDTEKEYLNVIGLNPSTADESEDDPTLRRCIGFAKDWGYGGLTMTNLFAYRATKPSDMMQVDDPVGIENNKYLIENAKDAGMVLFAWGATGNHLDRDKAVIDLLPCQGYCLKVTNEGMPGHPLYIKKNTTPLLYDYINH